MNKFGLSVISIALLASCSSSDHGELVGVQNRPEWFPTEPYGMVFVPQGSFNMGLSDPDVPAAFSAPTKTVSIAAFYMDQTEITNNEYRQFVNWVRDSIVRFRLAEDMIEGYEWVDVNEKEEQTFYDEYVAMEAPDSLQRHLNWQTYLEWDTERYPSVEYTEVIESIYLPFEERFFNGKMVDARQLNYVYFWIDKLKASKKGYNRVEFDYKDEDGDGEYWSYNDYIKATQEESNRSSFFNKEVINIYPDTLVWIADFAYGFNEPMHDKYFWHPAYDDYPVVGVSWKQANAFCNWRSKYRRDYLRDNHMMQEHEFRLPTEGEWEYAARGGSELTTYPWGGPYATNSSGCFLANFKPSRGNLTADGGFYPVKATSYSPNGYNLFCMGGNVAEWTSTAYDEASFYYVSDFNPDYQYNAQDYESETMKRKVIRGGSWKDIAFFMQNGTRTYEYQDTAKSYVGFRTIQNFLGRDPGDF
ncbi:MAG: gliding motility-associated lipoprotein [Bacteroidetes bacterium]|uniref:SUMF1/EgtB/PvdO family nonheme iron enzyme n=1 Tax=Phaeocystidibacter marisrubri TaxID=1577780 RepID=A0A6L3ZH92_9FLAO|nr:SUMF1/EgtB/PvdO family nonheme iron enzyme [Phaeocystidibacter marisrubri]KAB2816855.1 SUMF1/EgtB/PvdO family nonheme iron enzyme [Phaeocystidibacter marisrubri]TNE29892.1 MAG: gliding motility-associated lipoprotein [Bacteroidota bacterium]